MIIFRIPQDRPYTLVPPAINLAMKDLSIHEDKFFRYICRKALGLVCI